MIVKQKLSILVLPKWKKTDSKGMTPIYLRITIDGLEDELSVGCKVAREHWNNETKQVNPGSPGCKDINKKVLKSITDVERHFDLMQVKHGVVTPIMVKESYITPVSGQRLRIEKAENAQFSEELDDLISKYLTHCEKVKAAYAEGRIPSPDHKMRLDEKKAQLKREIDELQRKANKLFDKKDRVKTLLLTINDYLLEFMQLAFTGNRAYTTLEKWMGRKRRYLDFLQHRYKVEDVPLAEMNYSFIGEVFKYMIVQHEVIENTAMKYAQCIKEMMDRAVARGWISANVFVIFKCQYEDTDRKWPTLAQVQLLIGRVFSTNKLNEIRDIFVFECFTGLSYAEMRRLSAIHIIRGGDGKKWISMSRQKTDGDETLPLLPTAQQILERYQDHPVCVRRRTLLPVPTNEEYNRCLKEIAEEAGLSILLTTHIARYFFANVVMFDNGIQLKIIAGTLGQKSIATAAKYVKTNKGNISKAMETVEGVMFSEEGELLPAPDMSEVMKRKRHQSLLSDSPGAKVVAMPLRK
jgi:site-specific recombinase XerD